MKTVLLFWKKTVSIWFVPGFAIGSTLGFFLGLSLNGRLDGWFIDGIWPEALGIVFTVSVIEVFNRRRDQKNRLLETQERLKREAASLSNEIAKNAISELRKRDWLRGENGLLAKVDFLRADLRETDLTEANLKGCSFVKANLMRANLGGATLTESDLSFSNLTETTLADCDLSGANLFDASLDGANLEGANLSGATLEDTKGLIKLNRGTTLPDGRKWSPQVSLADYGSKMKIQ